MLLHCGLHTGAVNTIILHRVLYETLTRREERNKVLGYSICCGYIDVNFVIGFCKNYLALDLEKLTI